MGLDFNIKITRKITVNGKEYESLDEVPQEQRHALQKAMGVVDGKVPGKLIVNGVGYDSPEAMPPEARKIHDEAFKKAAGLAQKKGINLAELGIASGTPAREGALSLRTTLILIALAALFLLGKFCGTG